VLGREGVGAIVFSPLAQGMLTDKYLDGIPQNARVNTSPYLSSDMLTDATLGHIRALNDIARERGQTLAQMAVAWTLRDPRVTSSLIGASSVAQLEDTVAAVRNIDFSDEELQRIDQHAVDSGINIWQQSSDA
jgi:L-glyceraldehyde 3-phosphate reductase